MPIRKISDEKLEYCTSDDHCPPNHMYLEPGLYEYECPKCEFKQMFAVKDLMSISEKQD